MGEEGEDEGAFLPLDVFYGTGLSDRRQRDRERRIADHVARRREHGERPPGRRGLSRADIVATAVIIADAEGTDAISMRRIARELRVGPMSLYWHVASTDELHQLMLEQVQAESRAPEPSGDWRADVHEYAANCRAALLRHPWAIDFLGIGPPSGANDARNGERMIAAFDEAGIDLKTTMWVLMTIATYVMGAALREVQETRWQQATDERTADLTEAELAGHMAEFDRRIRGSGNYPHIARMIIEDLDPDDPETRDERFEFGLGCLLDGIEARVRAAAQSGARG
jgi:AcrR family transcriptional regulator